jgi:hypothetical protein
LPFTEDSDEDREELTQDNESTKFVKYYSTGAKMILLFSKSIYCLFQPKKTSYRRICLKIEHHSALN